MKICLLYLMKNKYVHPCVNIIYLPLKLSGILLEILEY